MEIVKNADAEPVQSQEVIIGPAHRQRDRDIELALGSSIGLVKLGREREGGEPSRIPAFFPSARPRKRRKPDKASPSPHTGPPPIITTGPGTQPRGFSDSCSSILNPYVYLKKFHGEIDTPFRLGRSESRLVRDPRARTADPHTRAKR